MKRIDKKTKEALIILQEEAAEVIHIISKIFRFGMDYTHPNKAMPNKTVLVQEIGDFLALVDILAEQKVISDWDLDEAKIRKVKRLEKWSTLYK